MKNPQGGTSATPAHQRSGRVTSAAYLGDHIEYEIDSPAGRLFIVDADNLTAMAPGAAVRLQFRGGGAALIA